METNEINILASTVFRNVEQVDYVLEPAGSCEIRSDVAQCNRDDRIDFDFAALHAVSLTRPYVWPLPHADAGRDLTRSHAVAKILDEEHGASLDRGDGKQPKRSPIARVCLTSLRFTGANRDAMKYRTRDAKT